MMHATPLGLALALTALPGLAAPQKPAKSKPTKTAPATALAQAETPSGIPIAGMRLLRAAPCTLVLRGRTEIHLPVSAEAQEQARAKTIVQDFEFSLAGRLTETTFAAGDVEFVFTPAESSTPAAAETQARLHLEDDHPAPGWAPIVMDATRFENAGPLTFKSFGRGQAILPMGGAVVNLKGRLASQAPMTVATALGETENRPVAATPLLALEGDIRRLDVPIVRFQGPALWAWANSPAGLTLRGTVDYRGTKMRRGSVTGQVELTFKIGATETAPN